MEWIGRTIDGRYDVSEVIGTGGMGVVLRARHRFTGEDVAVKMLKPSMELEPDLQARFLAESKMPSAIGHPGIVRVLDAGKTPEGSLYLAMELLVGQTLRSALGRGDVPARELRRIVLELLDALGAAHARGFVHRDLKPENVFLAGPARTVKLLDFGIAKGLASGIATPRTAAGVVLGTIAYMAPEQLRDARSVDARADLWAVGVMMYEAIAGRLPFVAGTTDSLASAVAGGEPEPIRRFVPDAPPELHAFFARALARAPEARFATAAEMASALTPLPLSESESRAITAPAALRGVDATAPTAATRPPGRVDAAAPTAAAAATPVSATPDRSRRTIAIVAALAVVLVVVIALALHARSDGPPAGSGSAGSGGSLAAAPAGSGTFGASHDTPPAGSGTLGASHDAPPAGSGAATLPTGGIATEIAGVTARIAYARATDGVLRLGIALQNPTDTEIRASQAISYRDLFIVDRTAKQESFPFQAADGIFVAGPMSDRSDGGRWFPIVPPHGQAVIWATFPLPAHRFDVHMPLAPSFDDVAVDASTAPSSAACIAPPLTATVTKLDRSEDLLTVELAIENPGADKAGPSQGIRYQDAYVLDPVHRKRYAIIRDHDGMALASPLSNKNEGGVWFARLDGGKRVTMKLVFQAPPDPVERVDIVLPLFAPLESVALTGHGGAQDLGAVVTSRTSVVGK